MELIKLLDIVTTMDIKKHQQVCSLSFLIKKTGSEISSNEKLPKELHKPVTKTSKGEKSTRDLKTIFGQHIQLKWDRCLQRTKKLNVSYKS